MSNSKEDTPAKIKWLPLEANPDVWNKIIHENGVDPSWEYTDVWGLDAELLPSAAKALVFLFPINEQYEQYRKDQDDFLEKEGHCTRNTIHFFKQTISNACGMMAILHSLANNTDIVGPGLFKNIIDETRTMSPEDRGKYLESLTELANVHQKGANEGQTEAPSLDDEINLHFVCFVKVDNIAFELDGRRPFSINHSDCEDDVEVDLVKDSVKAIKEYIALNPNETNYSVIALTKKQ